jgi:hypothetical protein
MTCTLNVQSVSYGEAFKVVLNLTVNIYSTKIIRKRNFERREVTTMDLSG